MARPIDPVLVLILALAKEKPNVLGICNDSLAIGMLAIMCSGQYCIIMKEGFEFDTIVELLQKFEAAWVASGPVKEHRNKLLLE